MKAKYKILHLEDVSTDAELAARELRKSNIDFEHLVIDTEQEYINALHTFQPDLILCDHSLPSFNSVAALRIKRMQKLHIPFILITATMSEEVAVDLVREGADDYILKDSIRRLPHAVRNALEKYGLERERKLFIDRVVERETQSQEELKKLTNRLLLANKASALGVWDYFVEEGRIVCDDYLLSIYGRTQDDFDGSLRSWLAFLHVEDRIRVKNRVKAAWNHNRDLDIEFRALLPDGSVRYVRSIGMIEYDRTGKAYRMVGTNKDITERKMAHQVLLESEERFRAFFENSMDAILLMTPDGSILSANQAASQIFGRSESELIAGGRAVAIDTTDPNLQKLLEQREKTGKMRGEVTCLRKDGTPFPAEITSAIFKDKYGGERTSMIIRDMTEWKATQNRLLKSEAGLKEAQHQARLGNWTMDVTTNSLEWSDEVYRILERAPNESGADLGRFMNLVHPEDKPFVLAQYKQSVVARTPVDFIHRVMPGGKIKYVHVRMEHIVDGAGQHIRTAGTIQDVTERHLAEKAIQASEAFSEGILNSLSAHIAVVNAAGFVVKVNQSWRDFAANNQPRSDFQYCEGADYFKACENSNDPEVLLILRQIKEVLAGTREQVYIEYPCHAPNTKRWFYMQVKLFESAGRPLLLIEHQYITERKIAEHKLLSTSHTLQQTLNDLNKIMDSSLDVICYIDATGRFIRVSAAAQNVWGYAPEELIGKRYIDLVYPEDKDYTNEVAHLVMQGFDFTNFENRYVRKDGTVVPLLWSASWNDVDKTLHCVARDATEKKRLDAAFENERKRFATLFDQAPSCIGVFKGPDHIFELANPFYLQLTGRQGVLGKPVRAVFPEFEGQGIFELLDQAYASGVSSSGKEQAVQLDLAGNGTLTTFYTNFVYQPYCDNNGQIEGIFYFAVDVTEQVISRKRIEEKERNYSLLFYDSPLPQFIVNKASQQFIEVNEAALRQYGYTRDEFMRLAPSHLNLSGDMAASFHSSRYNSELASPGNSLVYHRNKAGERLIVEMKAREITYHGVQALLYSISDLTNELKLQEEMVDLKVNAQKKVTQAHIRGQEKERAYIGRELHDNINQQLTTAKLYMNLAKDREDLRLPLVEKCETVIQKTINEIRSLSKAFMLPTQDDLSLDETLQELLNTYSQFENLQFHLTSHECLLEIDEDLKLMFYRIIQEQLNNIIKYAACKHVWIEFDMLQDAIYLQIKDDGKGFDTRAKRKGIGLSNIKSRLELHDGEMEIISAPGEGCTIRISVPLV